ncbi:Cell division protein ZapE [Thalassocella blandensis]|nr:Cell division protein ZapE [Thalassocella blandensis]
MSFGPMDRYQRDLKENGFQSDPAQEVAVQHLQRLYDEIVARHMAESESKFHNLLAWIKPKKYPPLMGLYFWGGVGRGKTYLMDAFFESLPIKEKQRTHFHRFMRRVHQELKLLKNQKDTLDIVADKLASEAKVLCFDEFFVSDITDAMILANLLQALFDRGVTLVATSNIIPDHLYKDGLQRARFLPAIALLKQYTEVVNVDGGVDYRLRTLEQAELFYSPLDQQAQASLTQLFSSLVPDTSKVESDKALDIEGREICALKVGEGVAWFEFRELCDGPRSQNDYIELAREFNTILVANVPALGERNDDQAKRFIYLVDEFYDRNVKLIISAEKDIPSLYGQGKASFEFQRTVSRLLEMQSQEYLARAHKA